MYPELSAFAARLRGQILAPRLGGQAGVAAFNSLALELFALQFRYNPAYQKICVARGVTPPDIEQWTQIPSVPSAAFKELELTSLLPKDRLAVFYSSGTTGQKPSRHFHNAESSALYESSLWNGFKSHFGGAGELVFLTPDGSAAPHSSLIHMFEIVRQKYGLPVAAFAGGISDDGSWKLDFSAVLQKLKTISNFGLPLNLLGTAFSFVHLLDHLAGNQLQFKLPHGSRAMETGGYKNRSRYLPRTELHALITDKLGIPPENIICEYGMSELSSQAYDAGGYSRIFHFPSWARMQIISPETGGEVAEGETGIIRILDLANVFSVSAIQTEDLGIRRGDGFELIGRAELAESRGCSLMTA